MVDMIPTRPSAYDDSQPPEGPEGEKEESKADIEPEVAVSPNESELVEIPEESKAPVELEPEDEPVSNEERSIQSNEQEPYETPSMQFPADSVELPDLDPRGDPDNVRFFVKGSTFDNSFPRPYEGVLAKYQTPAEFRIATLYPKMISKVMKVVGPIGKQSIALKTLVYRWQCWLMPVRGKDGFERIELNKKYIETNEHRTLKKNRLPADPTGLLNSIKPKQQISEN